MKTLTNFSKNVISTIKKIPKGKVASYGQIAALAGKPHGSRGVSWILHSSSKAHALPWQRVLNSKGKISFPPDSDSFLRQKALLLREGVEFISHECVNLKASQWQKFAKKQKLSGKSKKR